jgi:hypothetical protein
VRPNGDKGDVDAQHTARRIGLLAELDCHWSPQIHIGRCMAVTMSGCGGNRLPKAPRHRQTRCVLAVQRNSVVLANARKLVCTYLCCLFCSLLALIRLDAISRHLTQPVHKRPSCRPDLPQPWLTPLTFTPHLSEVWSSSCCLASRPPISSSQSRCTGRRSMSSGHRWR